MQIKSPGGGTFIHMDGKVESLPEDWESVELLQSWGGTP